MGEKGKVLAAHLLSDREMLLHKEDPLLLFVIASIMFWELLIVSLTFPLVYRSRVTLVQPVVSSILFKPLKFLLFDLWEMVLLVLDVCQVH